ncbi:MAG: hypothetical protein IT430_12290 [Phycisphaerales bacterium]|nr:hypothetical protein [Phycisphaerales bacterium]
MTMTPRADRTLLAMLLSAALGLCALCTGCATSAPRAGTPDDFSLDLAVLPQSGAGRSDVAQHYILHADGTLRAARGPAGALNAYPGQARRLSSAQMTELLNLARQTIAMAAQSQSIAPTQWLHEEPLETGPAMLLWVRDSGDEHAARFNSEGGQFPAPAEMIRRRLQELALLR